MLVATQLIAALAAARPANLFTDPLKPSAGCTEITISGGDDQFGREPCMGMYKMLPESQWTVPTQPSYIHRFLEVRSRKSVPAASAYSVLSLPEAAP